jgi:hypothetical protein
MTRVCALATIGIALGVTPASANKYAEMDKARAAIIAALDSGDDKAFAAFVGKDFEVVRVWFDSAPCRKKFSTGVIKAKDTQAFVACFKGLGVRAQGLMIKFGPDVTLAARIEIDEKNGNKATLTRLIGEGAVDATLPLIWSKTFASHRKPGGQAVAFDAAAQKELGNLGESGVVFDVCVDEKGAVTDVQTTTPVNKKGPVMKQLRAATANWQFEPFQVRGKPAPACGRQIVRL